MEEEFAKIVDGIGYEGGHTEIVGTRLRIFECEAFEIDACKIQKCVFVEGAKVGFSLEVACICSVKGCMDLGLNGVEAV